MYLTMNNIENDTGTPIVVFEKVAKGLIMVNINYELLGNSVPSYWRLTAGEGLPPLEIGVDCLQRRISGFTFYADSANIGHLYDFKADTHQGTVAVNTDLFKRANDYIDINQWYFLYVHADKLVCLFVDSKNVKQAITSGRLEIYVDAAKQIVGFAICNLTDIEKAILATT